MSTIDTSTRAHGQPLSRPPGRPSVDSLDAHDPVQDTLRTDLSSHLSSQDDDALRRVGAGSPRSPVHDTAQGQQPDHIPAEHMMYYTPHIALADEHPDKDMDMVQVRELALGNGQKATVIMEAGRIRRIVTTDGQVAELQWASSPRCPRANQGRIPLSVSLSSMEVPAAPSDRPGRPKERLLSEPVLPRMWQKLSSSTRLASGSNLIPPRNDITPASVNALHYEGDPQGDRGSGSRRSQSASDVDRLRRGLYAPSIEPQYRGRHTDRRPHSSRPNSALLHQALSQEMPTIVESQYSGRDAAAKMREAAGMPHPALRGSSTQLPVHAPTAPKHRPGSYAPQQAAGARSWQAANAGMPVAPIIPPALSGGAQIRRSRSHPVQGSGPRSQRPQSSRSLSRAASLPATAAEVQRQLQQPMRSQKVGFWRRLRRAIFPGLSFKRFKGRKQLAADSELVVAAPTLSRSRSRGPPATQTAPAPEARTSRYAAPIADTAFEQPGRAASRRLPVTVQQQPPLRPQMDRWGSGSYRDSVPVSPKSQTFSDGPSRLSREKSRTSNASSLEPPRAPAAQPEAPQGDQAALRKQRSSRMDSLASIDPRATSWQTHNHPMLAKQQPAMQLAGHDLSPIEGGGEMMSRRERRRRDSLSSAAAAGQLNALQPKLRAGMVGRWRRDASEGVSGAAVDELLQMSKLQRLAREKITEVEIVELEGAVQIIWHICLSKNAARISKTEHFHKSGEVVEGPRRDGRPGILRSQLSITPEGHVHIRSLQSEPFSAVFHDRFKLSTGARRIKFDQKFQLLAPGVLPVKHHSIWHRIVEE